MIQIVSKVGSEDEVRVLQSDLNKMLIWSQDWQMLFNIDKSKVIHFGFNNKGADYLLWFSKLSSADEERDLGVIIDISLKPSKQCMKAAIEQGMQF